MSGPASIDVTTTTSSNLVVSDAGSWAADDLFVYRPETPSGWYSMGDYAVNKHGEKKPSLFLLRAVNDDPSSPLLTPPIGFTVISNIHDGNGNVILTLAMPIPPVGYVAMGAVVIYPILMMSVMCIKESAVVAGTLGDMIWRDLQLGDGYTRCWGQQITLDNGNLLSCNTFYGLSPSKSDPPSNAPVWAPSALKDYS